MPRSSVFWVSSDDLHQLMVCRRINSVPESLGFSWLSMEWSSKWSSVSHSLPLIVQTTITIQMPVVIYPGMPPRLWVQNSTRTISVSFARGEGKLTVSVVFLKSAPAISQLTQPPASCRGRGGLYFGLFTSIQFTFLPTWDVEKHSVSRPPSSLWPGRGRL